MPTASPREQRLEAWLDPGRRPWTIVGLAEGTLGYNRLQGKVEELGEEGDKTLTDGRVALYAKGRIRGKWLMTLAYDSDKKEDETRFGGVIDPQAYYTSIRRTERRYDAAYGPRLIEAERPQFYAPFGITRPDRRTRAGRYVRASTGQSRFVRTGCGDRFAADSPNGQSRQ